MRILSNEKTTTAYEQGVRDRAKSTHYSNPYPRNSAESKEYYAGWCEKNFVEFLKIWNR